MIQGTNDEALRDLDLLVEGHLEEKSATPIVTISLIPALNRERKQMPKAVPTLTRNCLRLRVETELAAELETLLAGTPDRAQGLEHGRRSWFGTDPQHPHRIQTHGKAFGSGSVGASSSRRIHFSHKWLSIPPSSLPF